MRIRTNYHTHHHLCGHAKGDAEAYAKEAVRHGFTVLGFSDHAPSPVYKNNARMAESDLEAYITDVNKTRRAYSGTLEIKLGLEAEYDPEGHEWLHSLKEKVEYLVLGQHYIRRDTDKHGQNFALSLSEGEAVMKYAALIEKGLASGFFDLLAHPDIYLGNYPCFDDYAQEAAHRIVEAAIQHRVPLEFNANGFRKRPDANGLPPYPRQEFFEIARRKGAQIVLSSDAHRPEDLYDESMEKALRILDQWGIVPKEKLDFI